MLFLIFCLCVAFFQIGTFLCVNNYDPRRGYNQPAYNIGYIMVFGSLFAGVESLNALVSDPEKVKELLRK